MTALNPNLEAIYPLTPLQEGLLFHALYTAAPDLYFEQWVLTLTGPLNPVLWRQAWQQVADRHPALRALFNWQRREKPLQIVLKTVNLPWTEHDLLKLSPPAQQAQLNTWLEADRQRGFDLAKAPPLRLALFHLSPDTWAFVLGFHHILLDGWSVSLIFEAVFAVYNALVSGQEPLLPPTRPYRDYLAWLQQQNMVAAATFWQQELAGLTAPTPLGLAHPQTDTTRPLVYAEQNLRLNAPLTVALNAVARQQQLTLNTLLQGAWALLLSLYSGESDVVFGATVSGRPPELSGVEQMVGLFINTLPVRAQVSPQAPLLTWLKELQTRHLRARQYEYSSLVNIQGWSAVPRGQPLFESLLVFENYPGQAAMSRQEGCLQVSDVRYFGRTNYPLTLTVLPGDELRLGFEYDLRRFDHETITRMGSHLETLLTGIAANPHRRLVDLPYLPESETRRLLLEWNNTAAPLPPAQGVHQLFEAQAVQTPAAVAVFTPNQTLTYQELNERANQLAHYLRHQGVGPETLVGICMERAPDMLIGLLAILKAGGAYVPLDPAYPPERLALMLDDTHLKILVTQQRMAAALPPHAAQRVYLDTDEANLSQYSRENPAVNVSAQNLAYIIYTSGSTGRPKGVMIQHSSLLNFAQAAIAGYSFTANDHILQFASLNFDTAAEEIYPGLACGATLALRTETMLSSPAHFWQKCREWGITVLDLPTAYWHELAADLARQSALMFEPPPSLRLVIIGGEKAQTAAWQTWRQVVGRRVQLINGYGPTEITVVALLADLTQADPVDTAAAPIGRPLANTQIYLLNSWLRPVPQGAAGQLYIGGNGLARGYLNRPDLTAEKFIPNPFLRAEGGRMKDEAIIPHHLPSSEGSSLTLYQTGDLARYRPDGQLEFMGRVDQQVKIRGFRIEPGEIEAALSRHPAVSEAIVAAQSHHDNHYLLAYIVPRPPNAPSPADLRAFLRQKLPDYMIPAMFIELTAVPRTPNGKIDRRALPTPTPSTPAQTYAPPHTPLEQTLAAIWAQVLGVERVGIEDNFFDLGGHSLQAIRLVSKMSAELGRDFSVRDIFAQPTIASLAQTLQETPVSTTPEAKNFQDASLPLPTVTAPTGLTLEARPLASLLASGKIAPVEAAALSYLSRADFAHPSLAQNWFDGLPVCSRILNTPLGRVAVILLPRFDTDLYSDEAALVEAAVSALHLAHSLGARVVSLTGLLPAATHYGLALTAAAQAAPLPAVSTGHATTAAAVVMTLERLLQAGDRRLNQETVGVLGLESVGAAALRLMLACLPHPVEIILGDLYHNRALLEEMKREIVTELGFKGVVRLVEASATAPPEFYQAGLIIGATNVPESLDITRVKPGAMVVDYSTPHGFNPQLAARRFENEGDILFSEGGVLQSPQPIPELRHAPRGPHLAELEVVLSRGLSYNQFEITGCVFSGLLSARFDDLKPTLGLTQLTDSQRHYNRLKQLGFGAAAPHCGDYRLNPAVVAEFRRRFGK